MIYRRSCLYYEKSCLLHVSVPALAFLLPDAALKPYWNNSHPPETHPSGNLLLHLTPQLKPKQKTVSIWMNFPVPCRIFSGSQLILNTDSASYVFNVSNATLECKGGMITGDEISIIYEGQLSGTDTGSVHVLKVVDEFHKKK